MNTRWRHGAALAATVISLAVTATPSLGASHPSAPATAIPDVTTLFNQAVKIVHRTRHPGFSHAVVLEADGLTRGGRGATSASGIVSWIFVFQNGAATGRTAASITLAYGPPPRRFARPVGHAAPFLEDVVIRRAPHLTLSQAVSLLRGAGHRRPFFNVTLRNPLGPKRLHPLYIFGFAGNRFVAVDTVTRRVAPIH